jgi:hypothetical protein
MVYGIYGIGFITSDLDHDQRASRPMTPSVPPPRLSTMSHESLWNAVTSWPAVGAISASSSQFEDDTNVRLKKSGVVVAEHVGITLGEWMAAISPAEKTRPDFYPFRFSIFLFESISWVQPNDAFAKTHHESISVTQLPLFVTTSRRQSVSNPFLKVNKPTGAEGNSTMLGFSIVSYRFLIDMNMIGRPWRQGQHGPKDRLKTAVQSGSKFRTQFLFCW